MSDMAIYTKEELLINLINQFQDAVVRAEVDVEYHKTRLKMAKAKSPEYKMFKQKLEGFKAMLEDKRLHLQLAKEHLAKMEKEK